MPLANHRLTQAGARRLTPASAGRVGPGPAALSARSDTASWGEGRVTTVLEARKDLPSDTTGYTLLELIVVLLMLSILLGFAIPAFQAGRVAGSQDSIARELLHAVNKLKIAALNRSRIHKLHLSLDENRIWVTHEDEMGDPKTGPPQTEQTLPDNIRIASVRFPGNREIRSGMVAIAFYPQGYSDRAVIRLSDGGSSPIDLVIEAFLPMAFIASQKVEDF